MKPTRASPRKATRDPARSAIARRTALLAAWAAAVKPLWGAEGTVHGAWQGVELRWALANKPKPCWHLLTRGLAGGFGYELALRVVKGKDELAPPAWALTLMEGLIARAHDGKPAPDPLQCLALATGIAPGHETELAALAFTNDPLVPWLDAGPERVPVLLAVPVARDEARVVQEWSPVGFLEVLAKVDPSLATDLERASLLQSPRARMLIDQRIEREGSSLASISAEHSALSRAGDRVTWTLSADAVEPLVSLLKGRTGHLRPFTVASGDTQVEVVNADAPRVELQAPTSLKVGLSLTAARQLRSLLKPKAGTYTFELVPNFAVSVV